MKGRSFLAPKGENHSPCLLSTVITPKGLWDTHDSSVIRKHVRRAHSVPGTVFGTQIQHNPALKKLNVCFKSLQFGGTDSWSLKWGKNLLCVVR